MLRTLFVLFLVIPHILLSQNNYVFGPSIRVNDDPPGSSWHDVHSSGQHGIACRGDTVYVVFTDERNSGYLAAYFSMSTDAGQTWSQNIRLAGGSSDFEASAASMALDKNDGIYVVFQSWESGNDANVYFLMSTDGGTSFSDSVLVIDTTYGQRRPSVAVDSSGQNIFVVWDDSRNSSLPPTNYDIYCSRSTDAGVTFHPSVRVDDTDTSTSWQMNPSIGCTQSGDTVYIAWDDERNPTRDVYFSRSIDGGQSFEANILVNDTVGTSPSSQRTPSLCVARSGAIYIVWPDLRAGDYLQVYCDRSTDGGVSFNQDVKVSDDSCSTGAPSVCTNDSEFVFVAWDDPRDFGVTGYDIYFSFSADSGNTFSPDVRVNDLGGAVSAWDWNANVTANNAGRVFVAWDTDRHAPLTTLLDIYCATGQYVGVEEHDNYVVAEIPIQISPNPFRSVLSIRWSNTDVYEDIAVRIYDISGKQVKTITKHASNHTIWDGTDDVGYRLPAGVYFCNISTAGRRYSAKVVKID
jgi:hypothetical protein